MNLENSANLEIIAPTPEEAIEKGLGQLGLPESSVEIEVLDTGSRGLFGIGSRQARVRLTIKQSNQPVKTVEAKEKPHHVETTKKFEDNAPENIADSEDDILQIAQSVVIDLITKMKVKAQVSAKYIQPEDEKEEPVIHVDIQGSDLSILIGRRSETLNALQYIAGLIINKKMGRLVPLVIDVQGYRSRRERQIRQLARRMAEQAVHTGRKQILEPMPANERRLLHLELRDHPKVITESVGEEPNRKITIRLKK